MSMLTRPDIYLTELVTMQAIMGTEEKHQHALRRRWERYTGHFPQPLKPRDNHPDDNVIVNKCKPIVNASVAFLFGDEVRFAFGGDDGDAAEKTAYLDAIWAANRRMTLLQMIGINGSWAGHVFVRLYPTSPVTDGLPRLVVLDPETVTWRCRRGDIGDVDRYRIQFNDTDPDGKVVVHRTTIEQNEQRTQWEIVEESRRASDNRWAEEFREQWPHAWPPIFHCQNFPRPNEFWGESDIEDSVIHLNEVKNLNLSLLQRTLVHHGYPKTIVKGMAASAMEMGPDSTIFLTNPAADISNLEMQSDGNAALELDNRIDEGLHQVAESPEVAAGKVSDLGNLSGVAIRILYRPLISRTTAKRNTYGDMLSAINRRLLELSGNGAWATSAAPDIQWPDTLPTNPKEEAETAVLLSKVGYSDDSLIEQTGGDPEVERDRRAQQQAAAEAEAEAIMRELTSGPRGDELAVTDLSAETR